MEQLPYLKGKPRLAMLIAFGIYGARRQKKE